MTTYQWIKKVPIKRIAVVATIALLGCGSAAINLGAQTEVETNATVVSGGNIQANISPDLQEIVRMANTGMSEEVILAYIENSPIAFNPTSEELIYLNDLGISTKVQTAIMEHGRLLRSRVAPTNAPAVTAPAPQPAQMAPEPIPQPMPQPEAQPQVAPVVVQPAELPPQVNVFYDQLSPYGNWVMVEDYGWCWQPTVAVVDVGWRPYYQRGRWLNSDCGWYWQSDYSWGWAAFHYGRWHRHPYRGWVWMPDTVWSPAWVCWRQNDAYCGWAPLPPGAYWDSRVGLSYYGRGHHGAVGIGFDFGLPYAHFSFVAWDHFGDRRVYDHCVPHHDVRVFFGRTSVVNHYRYDSGSRVVVNIGFGHDHDRRMGGRIETVRIADNRPHGRDPVDRVVRDGGRNVVYRPRLDGDIKSDTFAKRVSGESSLRNMDKGPKGAIPLQVKNNTKSDLRWAAPPTTSIKSVRPDSTAGNVRSPGNNMPGGRNPSAGGKSPSAPGGMPAPITGGKSGGFDRPQTVPQVGNGSTRNNPNMVNPGSANVKSGGKTPDTKGPDNNMPAPIRRNNSPATTSPGGGNATAPSMRSPSTGGSIAPAAPVTRSPSVSAPTYSAPATRSPAPSYSAPSAPATRAPAAPTYSAPAAPATRAPSVSAPTYSAPAPRTPAPAYSAPAPSYSAPAVRTPSSAPSYSAPSPAVRSTPAPSVSPSPSSGGGKGRDSEPGKSGGGKFR